MNTYHKINTIFKRDPGTNYKTLLLGQYSEPEFDLLKDYPWEITEKLDGTNIRVQWLGGEPDPLARAVVKGKTDDADVPIEVRKYLYDRLPGGRMHDVFGMAPVCMYGEGIGPKIQSGGKYGVDTSFVLFDVLVDNNLWLSQDAVADIGERLGLQVAPVFPQYVTLGRIVETVRDGINSAWGDFPAEGVVARPKGGLLSRRGKRIITKLKTKDFACV